MQLKSQFQPLDSRLDTVRSLAVLRLAVSVRVDPTLVAISFYFTIDQAGRVVHATDRMVEEVPNILGRFIVPVRSCLAFIRTIK